MRGKDRFVIDVYTEVRITPAHAGKRLAAPDARRTVWDHPRACGEKHSCINLGQHKRGSPPRMRGKGVGTPGGHRRTRITPAHAGKSGTSGGYGSGHQDHPRACGEKGLNGGPVKTVSGSPPRMRGKVPIFADPIEWDRITPAHAGKSSQPTIFSRCQRDHPRACGEKAPPSQIGHTNAGSPPRMRGKVNDKKIIQIFNRITPAHAGKRAESPARGESTRDHPRACGEKTKSAPAAPKRRGSPPRMRGKVRVVPRRRERHRITPAYAGKSDGFSLCPRLAGDHPRVCGEKHTVGAHDIMA